MKPGCASARERKKMRGAQVSFVVFRTKRSITNHYMGHSLYTLVRRAGGGFGIKSKRAILDLEGLVPQGKVSILL